MIFYQGRYVEGNSSVYVSVTMNTAEAECTGACNACMAVAHLENLDTEEFDNCTIWKITISKVAPVDNQATIQMSKTSESWFQ